jgi:hypothetical protein
MPPMVKNGQMYTMAAQSMGIVFHDSYYDGRIIADSILYNGDTVIANGGTIMKNTVYKITYAEGKASMDSKQITGITVLKRWPLLARKARAPKITAYIEGKDGGKSIPIEEVTEEDFDRWDGEVIQNISRDGTVMELTPGGGAKLEGLFRNGDAYLFDIWGDIPKSGLGAFVSVSR